MREGPKTRVHAGICGAVLLETGAEAGLEGLAERLKAAVEPFAGPSNACRIETRGSRRLALASWCIEAAVGATSSAIFAAPERGATAYFGGQMPSGGGLFESWQVSGDALLAQLDGGFALVLEDEPAGRVLLARDPLGIERLYLARRDPWLYFATDARVVANLAGRGYALDPAALAAYLEFGYVTAPDCLFEGVEQVCPGEKVVIRGAEINRERYWQPTFQPDAGGSFRQAARRLRELLAEPLRGGPEPLESYRVALQGGIESWGLAAMLRRLHGTEVETFRLHIGQGRQSERLHSRRLAAELDLIHREWTVRPDFGAFLPRFAASFDEPCANLDAIALWYLQRLASEQGIHTLYTGLGADELFGGHAWLEPSAHVRRFKQLPGPIRRTLDRALRFRRRGRREDALRRWSLEAFTEPYASFRRQHTLFGEEARARLLRPQTYRQAEADAVERFRELGEAAGDISPDNWMLYMDMAMHLPGAVFPQARLGAQVHGVQVRMPYVSRAVAEFALGLPYKLKAGDGAGKRVVRRALGPLLARARSRSPVPLGLGSVRIPQQGGVPVDAWFRGALREHYRDTVLGKESRVTSYLDTVELERLAKEHESGQVRHGRRLWALLLLEYWIRSLEGG